MAEKILVTRNQLAKFLPNPETIKAFENLFRIATSGTPDDLLALYALAQENSIDASVADSKANELSDYIHRNERQVLSIASDLSVRIGNYFISCDATSAAINVTLPLASSAIFFRVSILKKDTSANAVNILPSGTDTIAGEASQSLLFDGEYLEFTSDGTNWQVGG